MLLTPLSANPVYPRIRPLTVVTIFGMALVSMCLVGTGSVAAQESKEFTAEDLEFFEKKIRPILVQRCFECHGPDVEEPEGDLHMLSHESLVEGGGSGPAIDLENPGESMLIEAINYGGLYEMPPESKLPEAEIALITEWVERGAPWPSTEQNARIGPKKFDLEARRREHWCWQPIANPSPPEVTNTAWVRQPLDAFILAGLEKNGLVPAPEADRATLIRRVYFDLIGLPPPAEEVVAFVADERPDAYERLVDRLLASPHFGEHWARRWMDLVRYAETCGHEYDYPLPYANEYRDYLIRAFNADVPYDQFIREHVAGDLLNEPRRNPQNQINESIVATGFWFLGEATHGPVDVRGDEAGRIDNQIDVFGKTFLGLTIACARCHDHMFDAISTRDYYGLVGFMQSSRRQLAMLDPDRKIESAAKIMQDHQTNLDASLATFRSHILDLPDRELTSYFAAALECFDKLGPYSLPQSQKMQGEHFASAKPAAGTAQVQDLAAQNGKSWEGNQHLWWHGAKIGDSLTLKIAVASAGDYEIFANFTKASDYGVFRVQLDGSTLVESLDLFGPEIGMTGAMSLGKKELAVGEHELKFEIVGSNPKAAPKHMLGIDFIDLQARPEGLSSRISEIVDETASDRSLDQSTLRGWVDGLMDARLSEPQHPLYLLQQVIQRGGLSDASVRQAVLSEIANRRVDAEKILAESPLINDFDNAQQPGWFVSGEAYSGDSSPAWSADTSIGNDRIVKSAGTVSSGRLGRPFYGVLRSPTFLLEHKFVHWRVAGRDAEVRVIIDGFTLDIYNSLLFNGITLKVDSPDRFYWLAQGQDVGNYQGHRVHLELIDHSSGSVAIDEVRVSDHATIPELPTAFGESFLQGMSDGSIDAPGRPYEKLAEQFAQAIRESIAADTPDPVCTDLLDWFCRWNLSAARELTESRERLLKLATDRDQWLVENRVSAPIFAQAICDGTGENEFVFVRGNHQTLGDEAPRKMIEAIPVSYDFSLSPDVGSGRLQLAKAVASPDNPLTSRVIVNRLWHHLFGQGIVPSVDNFGVLGEKPSHAELLDHLATRFTDEGWSIKRALRNIATSSTYRMSSQMDPSAEQLDPDNRWLHRMAVRRLSSEAIRDSLLAVSGQLDPKMYGPSVPIYLTPFMEGRGRPDKSGPLDGDRRRSLYIEVRRNFLNPMMLTFDAPSPFSAVGRRTVSNVPSQALMMLNHPFVLQQAEVWANRILAADESDSERLNRMFREAYSRDASPADIKRSREFLSRQQKALHDAGISAEQSSALAWRDLCHVLINAKEFYYVR